MLSDLFLRPDHLGRSLCIPATHEPWKTWQVGITLWAPFPVRILFPFSPFLFGNLIKPLKEQKNRLEMLVCQLEDQVEACRQAEEKLRRNNEAHEKTVAARTADLAETVAALRSANEQLSVRAGQLRALAGELTMTEYRQRQYLYQGFCTMASSNTWQLPNCRYAPCRVVPARTNSIAPSEESKTSSLSVSRSPAPSVPN